ncbi:MAG: 50S ribosomal protein L18 [Chloroflexi bacterium]|nr:50S ribosomal protein L18 [Chloroflexota bacterium]
MAVTSRRVARDARHARVRERVRGTADRPRLAVFRSLHHFHAQLIDDVARVTIAAASSVEGQGDAKGSKSDVAKAVGARLGERAKAKGVEAAVFDRGGYRYHGRVKAFADAARAAGLRF